MRTSLAIIGGVGCVATGVYLYRQRLYKIKKDLNDTTVIIIETLDQWNQHKKFVEESCLKTKLFGLDCEWVSERNGHRHKIALLQIAPNESVCFIIRLSKLGECPTELVDILQNPSFIKVGVGIIDDSNKLFNDYNISCCSCIDLRYLVLTCDATRHMLTGSKSLQGLAKDILGIDLEKTIEITCSNWERDILTDNELQYAANDALVGYLIAKKACSMNTGLNPISVILNTSWMFSLIAKRYDHFLDIPFRQSAAKAQRNGGSNASRNPRKTEFPAYRISQKTIYDNCVLQAPDGEVLCSCDRRKPQWYINKGLAEVISEEPFVVRLKFEPKSRAILDRKFYTLQKANRCVVCGDTNKLVRKNVVPQEYRKFFPEMMKSHSSHDVVLLCVKCHPESDCKDLSIRRKLAKISGVPMYMPKEILDKDLHQVKMAAKALFLSYDKIPSTRREELEKRLKCHFKVEKVDKDLLEKAMDMDCTVKNDAYSNHAEAVINYFSENGGLVELCQLWRQHFLDSMRPKFLPDMWSVDHNKENLAIEVMLHHNGDENLLKILGYTQDYVQNLMNTERVQNELERLQRVKRNGSVEAEVISEEINDEDDLESEEETSESNENFDVNEADESSC